MEKLEYSPQPPALMPLGESFRKEIKEADLLWSAEGSWTVGREVYRAYGQGGVDLLFEIPVKILQEFKEGKRGQWVPPVFFLDEFCLVRKMGEEIVLFRYWFSSGKAELFRAKIPEYIQQ